MNAFVQNLIYEFDEYNDKMVALHHSGDVCVAAACCPG
jgi:hypothetical protein